MRLGCDKVMVTGGAGFIGSHTVDALLQNGLRVWALDNLSSGTITNLRKWRNFGKFHFEREDVANYKAVNRLARKVDAMIHLAAIVSPEISIRKPQLTNMANVVGTLNVLRAGQRNEVDRVVFASSSSVYGNSKVVPISEDTPLEPITTYGASKVAAEKYCKVFYKAYGLKTVLLRYFNVYGERQPWNPYSGVIAIFARRLLRGTPPVIHGDGDQTRDFVHVSDVVNANLLALQTETGSGEAFNIGTGLATSIRSLSKLMINLVGKDVTPVFKNERTIDIRRSCARISKARKLLGFSPKINLSTGLRMLIEPIRSR